MNFKAKSFLGARNASVDTQRYYRTQANARGFAHRGKLSAIAKSDIDAEAINHVCTRDGINPVFTKAGEREEENNSSLVSFPVSSSPIFPVTTTNKRILLVEDEENTAILLQDYLQTIGYEVEKSLDSNSFLHQVRNFQPDLILLDVHLTGDVSGWDLLNLVRQIPSWQDLPVVIMTPMGMTVDRDAEYRNLLPRGDAKSDTERLRQAGADDFLSKPIGIVQLESILMRYLGNG